MVNLEFTDLPDFDTLTLWRIYFLHGIKANSFTAVHFYNNSVHGENSIIKSFVLFVRASCHVVPR